MRILAVLWFSLKILSWFTFRAFFQLFRHVAWIFRGVSSQARRNLSAKHLHGVAHVQRIRYRFKIDPMIQPASLNNFVTTHERFADADYVMKPNVTLYTLTNDSAVFVEAGNDEDATSSKHSSFFRIAQFQLAQRLIIIPLHAFHTLARDVTAPEERLIFLTNTSRCGSTLLTQVFEETGKSIAISEPDAMYAISVLMEKNPDQDFSDLCISTVRMLCKPVSPEKNIYVIKLSQQTICLTPVLVQLFPKSKHLFMYRNGLKVAQSVAKLMRSLPYLEFIFQFAHYSCCMNVARRMTTKFGLPTSDFDNVNNLISPIYCGAILWASSIAKYKQFKRDKLPVVAVRYEDMVNESHYALEQIFNYCGLPYQREATDRAFGRDSQENSPISRSSLKKFEKEDKIISEEATRNIDKVCRSLNVPRLYERFIAQDTITYKTSVSDTSASAVLEVEVRAVSCQNARTIKSHQRNDSGVSLGSNYSGNDVTSSSPAEAGNAPKQNKQSCAVVEIENVREKLLKDSLPDVAFVNSAFVQIEV